MNKGANNSYSIIPTASSMKNKEEKLIKRLEEISEILSKDAIKVKRKSLKLLINNLIADLKSGKMTMDDYKELRKRLVDITERQINRHEETLYIILNEDNKIENLDIFISIILRYYQLTYKKSLNLEETYGLDLEAIKTALEDNDIKQGIIKSFKETYKEIESDDTFKYMYERLINSVVNDIYKRLSDKKNKEDYKAQKQRESFLKQSISPKKYQRPYKIRYDYE